MDNSNKPFFIIIGTDPNSGLGGISISLQAFLQVFTSSNIDYVFLATHHPQAPFRQFWPLMKAIPAILHHLLSAKRQGSLPILYAHLGPGVSMVRKFLAMLICRLFGAKIVCHLHSLAVDRYLSNLLGRLFLSLCISPAHTVCVLTDWWARKINPVVKKRIFIVPNPLNDEMLNVAQKGRLFHYRNEGRVIIFSMCRLVSGKGVDLLVKAMQHLPDNFELRIGGDGGERSCLAALVNEYGLDKKVSLLGWLDPAEKAEQFRQADIFCLPSQQDSFGMVFIEAMAYGLPIVALRFGAIPDVVAHGKAGLLVDAPDPQKIAEAIMQIAEFPTIQCMGDFGKQWVLDNYAPSVIDKKINEIAEYLTVKKQIIK